MTNQYKQDFLQENLNLAPNVQSQFFQQPSPHRITREGTSDFYRNFINDVQQKGNFNESPIKEINFMGESIKKLPSKTISYKRDFELANQFSKTDFKNNEEIKNYLTKLDTLLQSTKKKDSVYSPLKIEKSFYVERSEEQNNNSLGKSKYLEENEGLKYLAKKYMTQEIKHKLHHSTILIRSTDHWNLDNHEYQLGEILCINCQEFINPDEINAHSIICDKEINNLNIGFLNDKIENMKLLLIINYKNSPPNDSEEFDEFENFIQIGTVIIDEIIQNNIDLIKLKENFEDLKELYYSMNRLRTKKMVAVKSLVQRMFQVILMKIEINEAPPVHKTKNNIFNNSFDNSNFNFINENISSPPRSPLRPRDFDLNQRKPVSQKKHLMEYFDEDQ